MRSLYASLLALLFCFSATSEVVGQAALDLPIRINLGGRAVTDSNGNAWLADEGVNVDSLGIRPNDVGGGQAIVNWSAAVVPDSVTALGFDGNNAEDLQIFKDIRWDNAGEVPDWNMEFTVPNGVYEVNFYLVDAGDGRHYQFALEGEVVADDVHQLAFPVGDGMNPGPNIAGKYSFIQIVNDGSLSIDVLPGWGFPDPNPIMQGIEILESDEDPCAEATAEQLCPRSFSVEVVNNVAPLGTATASSDCHGSVPSRAIDGNIDGFWGNASTTHTCNEADPWWEVDLHNTYDCDNIKLWNRSDCCQERMAGITLQILDEAREVVFEVNGLDALRERLISVDTEGTPGRFVRISRNEALLSLSEVQIFSASAIALGNWSASLCGDAPQGHNVYLNDELFLELDGDATGFVAAMPEVIGRDATFTLQAGNCESSVTGAFGLFEIPLRINFSGPDFVDGDGNLWLGDQNGPGDALGIRPNDSNGANHILDWCGGGGLSNIRWDSDSYHHPFEIELPMANGLYSASLQFCEACCANRNFHVIVEGVNAGRVQQAGGERTTIVAETVVGDGSLSIVLIGIPGGDVNALITALEVVSLVPEICDNGIDDNDDGAVDCADAQCPPCPEICDNGTDDDRDGRVDCADDDCAEAASCIEICDNGVDDNGDGDVDGDDIQCSELEFAGEILVSLDARDGTAGSDLWRNRGSMGDFQRVGAPVVEERDHGIGVSFNENGRSGETYESVENAPAGVVGPNPTRSIEIWVWPSTTAPNEETLVSWGKRGGPDGSNMSFLWGNNASHGAVGHWGGPDLGYNNGGGIPRAQQWHHLVYTYDGETTRVYTDNCLVSADCANSNEEFLGLGRINTHAGTKIRIAQQTQGDGVNIDVGIQGKILVSKVRVHDGVLSPEQISHNYELELPEFLPPPEECDDGVDNDGDGDTDCEDDECPPCPVLFVRGDANGDGGIDISDPTHTLRNLFAGGPGAPCSDSADANDDGGVSLTDAIYSLNYLFRGDAAPVAPFPACGVDVTADDLGCLAATAGCE